MKPEIKIFNTTEEIAIEIAETILKLSKSSQGNLIHIALSGGSTPIAIFNYLTEKYGSKLASNQFYFWWGDDRCVPPTHNDSNYKWANDLWLSPIGIPSENIHRVYGENNPSDEAKRYSEEIKKFVPFKNGLPVFDVMILGLGEDGHTASIFPHQMELLDSSNYCEVAIHPSSGQQRITMTGSVLNNSSLIIFLATGNKKAQKVKEIIQDKNVELPAFHIKSEHGKTIWFLDKQSAELL